VAENVMIQGRRLHELELQSIRQWLGEHPDWSRWRLSRELATRWDWRNGAGQLTFNPAVGRAWICGKFFI
jgi:hypothetical protein